MDPETAWHEQENQALFEEVCQAVEEQFRSNKMKWRICRLFFKGMGKSEIAQKTGVPYRTVNRHVNAIIGIFKKEWAKRLPAAVVILCVIGCVSLWNKLL